MSQPITLQSALQEWFDNVKKAKVSHNTFTMLRRAAKNIYNYLGKNMLSEITPAMLQNFIDSIEAKAIAHKSRQILKEFFGYCVKQKNIKKNPASKLTTPYIYHREKRVSGNRLNTEEYARLMSVVSKHIFWNPFCLLLQSKVRFSEIIALTWKDVDFDKNRVDVNKYVTLFGSAQGEPYHTRKYRPIIAKTVTVSDDIIEAIKKYRLYRELEQMRVANHYSLCGADDLIFGNKHGTLLNYSGVSHVFRKFLDRRGLSDMAVNFSTIRNTFAVTPKKETAIIPVWGEIYPA